MDGWSNFWILKKRLDRVDLKVLIQECIPIIQKQRNPFFVIVKQFFVLHFFKGRGIGATFSVHWEVLYSAICGILLIRHLWCLAYFFGTPVYRSLVRLWITDNAVCRTAWQPMYTKWIIRVKTNVEKFKIVLQFS